MSGERDVATWIEGVRVLRAHAVAARGSIELSDGRRWPRTTGEQVAAIAAAFTPAVRASARAPVLRRWRAIVDEIEADALAHLDDTYAGNRVFWATLETVALELDERASRPPGGAAWRALCAVLDQTAARNAAPPGDGPFKHFEGVKTFDELYNAQAKYLREVRGFDNLMPDPGMAGGERFIPRATNADVVALADFWAPLLADSKTIMGSDRVIALWRAAMTDVERLARHGEPTAVYAKNNTFWRALMEAAIHIAVAADAPTKWELAKESIKDSIVHLPDTIGAVASKGVAAVSTTAHAAGKVLNEAGKGLFSGAGVPILVGAGVLGAVLLFRGSRRREEA